MTLPLISLVFALVGALLWWVASPPKLSEAGRLMFFTGILGIVMMVDHLQFRL